MRAHPLTPNKESGISLLGLLVGVTITLIFLAAALPSWKQVIKREREEELIYRGCEIAEAVVRFQNRNGGAFPTSLDALVRGRLLRRAHKDPMTKDGKWRLLSPGERATGQPLVPMGAAQPAVSPAPSPPSIGGPGGTPIGPFVGVATLSKEKSFRTFFGKSKYDEWRFIAGPQCMEGKVTSAPTVAPVGATPAPTPPGR